MTIIKKIKALFHSDIPTLDPEVELKRLEEWREQFLNSPTYNPSSQFMQPEFEELVRAGKARVGYSKGTGNACYGPFIEIKATCSNCRFFEEQNSIVWGTNQEEQRTHTKRCVQPKVGPRELTSYSTPTWCPYLADHTKKLMDRM